MFYLLAILLTGISFIPLVLPIVNIWIAQGWWVMTGSMLALAWMTYEKPRYIGPKNLPMALMLAWVTIQTSVFGLLAARNGQGYVLFVRYGLTAYFSFLCMFVIYKATVHYLNTAQIKKILEVLRYVVIATLFVCITQIFGFSQFFKPLFPDNKWLNNIVTGFLGNGTHLSGFLGSCIPLFLWKLNREDKLALVLLFGCLFFTSTTLSDPAISGFAILALLMVYFNKKNFDFMILGGITALVIAFWIYPHIDSHFFHWQGRPWMWKHGYELWKEYPITGRGLGIFNFAHYQITKKFPPHMHLEYFHYMVELGVVGLGFILYWINDFLHQKARDRLELVLKALVIGFLLSGLFNFPSHLWLPATWATFFYASFCKLKGEHYGRIQPKRNKRPLP